MRLLAILLLVIAPAGGEFLEIEQPLTGLDCASCLKSVSASIRRLRGVESVEITPEGVARVQLKPENKVRLEAIRDAVKGAGFTPPEAKVRVRGKAVSADGKWEFHLEGLDQAYRLVFDEKIRLRAGELIVIEGVAAPPADPRAQPVLSVIAVRPDGSSGR